MIFTLTKTTCSQRGELFAKSDFHESIRLSVKVLCLRNSESCNLSHSVHLARRAMYGRKEKLTVRGSPNNGYLCQNKER